MHSHVCGDPVLHSRFCVLDGSRGDDNVPQTCHRDESHHHKIHCHCFTDMLAYVSLMYMFVCHDCIVMTYVGIALMYLALHG